MIRLLIAGSLLLAGVAQAGTPRAAAEIVANYEGSVKRWNAALKAAMTPEEQMKIWAKRPDTEEFGAKIWSQLRGSLRESWMLSYAPAFLEEAPAYAMRPRNGEIPAQEILKAVEIFHLQSPEVGRLCIALTISPNPETMRIVEKIAQSSPDPKVQGQAALAQALVLKNFGDGGENMRKRLTLLKEAIIKSALVKVGKNTVGELAGGELYVIQNLSKGREAPDLLGRDVAGAPMGLHAMRGKVVVLVFWRSWMSDANHVIEVLQRSFEEYQGRPVELVGVAGVNPLLLRTLRADGTVPWRNFVDADERMAKEYRVINMPQVFVIDQKGVIQHIGPPGAFVNLAVEALLADPER